MKMKSSCSPFAYLLVAVMIWLSDVSSGAVLASYGESINPPPAAPPLPFDLTGSLGFSASESSVDIPISRPSTYTGDDRSIIIGEHNRHRRHVSPPAANMNALKWDADLAAMAQGWSDQCLFEHGNPENSSPFGYVGQNLYIRYYSKAGQPAPKPNVPIQKWYDEVMNYTYADRSCSGTCGHYTQVVWADTTSVGCGQTYCETAMDNKGRVYNHAWIITCNYGPGGNYKGQYPYVEGEWCSSCASPGTCKGKLCKDCDLFEDSACSCKLQCENCGSTNTTTGECQCNCQKGFWGINCEKPCENTHRYCGKSPGWPNKRYCGRHDSIPTYCPLMCGICESPDSDFVCEETTTSA